MNATVDSHSSGGETIRIYNQPEDVHPESILINFIFSVESWAEDDRWLLVRDQTALVWLFDTLIDRLIDQYRESEDPEDHEIETLQSLKADAMRALEQSAEKIWKERDFPYLQNLLISISSQFHSATETWCGGFDDNIHPSIVEWIRVLNWPEFLSLPDTQYQLIAALGHHSTGWNADFDALCDTYCDRISALVETHHGLIMPGDEELIALAMNLYAESDQDEIGTLDSYLEELEEEEET